MAHVILIGTQSWSEHSALVLQMAMLGRLLLTKVVIADPFLHPEVPRPGPSMVRESGLTAGPMSQVRS